MSGYRLDDALIPVDALGKRWASWGETRGGPLHPLDAIEQMKNGAVLGGGSKLMPSDVKAWDICIEGEILLVEHQALLKTWYTRGSMSVDALASRFRTSRPTLYKQWNIALHSMRTALKVQGIKL